MEFYKKKGGSVTNGVVSELDIIRALHIVYGDGNYSPEKVAELVTIGEIGGIDRQLTDAEAVNWCVMNRMVGNATIHYRRLYPDKSMRNCIEEIEKKIRDYYGS